MNRFLRFCAALPLAFAIHPGGAAVHAVCQDRSDGGPQTSEEVQAKIALELLKALFDENYKAENSVKEVFPNVKSDSERFSQDSRILLKAISNGYDINGRATFADSDFDSVVRLASSKDPLIRTIATYAKDEFYLHYLHDRRQDAIMRSIQKRAEVEIPRIILDRVVDTIVSGNPEKETRGIDAVAKDAERLMGGGIQAQVNLGLEIQLLGVLLHKPMHEKMGELANRTTLAIPNRPEAILAQFDSDPQHLGLATITNRSGKPLRNVLVLTRLIRDKTRIAKDHNLEDTLGRFILPGIGLPSQLVKGSLRAGELRTRIFSVDRREIVFVPELPVGAKLRVLYDEAYSLPFAVGGEVSIYSEDLTVENKTVGGLRNAQVAFQRSRR